MDNVVEWRSLSDRERIFLLALDHKDARVPRHLKDDRDMAETTGLESGVCEQTKQELIKKGILANAEGWGVEILKDLIPKLSPFADDPNW